MTVTEKLLPQNVEAESAVLGSMLIDPETIRLVRDFLQAEDFYHEAHRTIYQTALDLCDANGPADLITLTDELEQRGKLGEVGGTSYVSSLGNQVPTSANAVHYARIVERTGYNRRLIQAAGKLAAIAYNDPDIAVVHESVMSQVMPMMARRTSGTLRTFAQVLDDLHDEVLARMDQDRYPGVRTGIGRLDGHILGIEPGELVYLAGRPGSGKSALGLRIALNAAFECKRHGEGTVDVVSLEMTPRAQARRLISGLAEQNTRYIRAGFRIQDSVDLDAYDRFKRAWLHYRDEVGSILYLHGGPLSLAGLRAHALRGVAERGVRLLLVDQLDLMADSGKDEYQRVTTISRELKQIALSVGVAIVCLVQLNRKVEERQNKRPMLADLRQSGQLEQDADMVWGLYRPAYYDPDEEDERFRQYAELLLLKVRDGDSGVAIRLRYEKEYTRFSDWPFDEPPVKVKREAAHEETSHAPSE